MTSIMSLGLFLKALEVQRFALDSDSTLQRWQIYLEAGRHSSEMKPYKKLILEAWKMCYDDEPNDVKLRKYVGLCKR